jgi:hypothetical protein
VLFWYKYNPGPNGKCKICRCTEGDHWRNTRRHPFCRNCAKDRGWTLYNVLGCGHYSKRAEEKLKVQLKVIIQAFPSISKLVFSKSLKELGPCLVQALSSHGIATERNLRYIGDQSLNDLFTTQGTPLTQQDKTKIQELCQRLVEEEKVRIANVEAESLKWKELVRVTEVKAETLKRNVVEATKQIAENDASRQKADQERSAQAKKEEQERQQQESSQRREEDHLQKARKELEDETVGRHSRVVEAEKIVAMADAEKKRAESAKQTKGPERYKAFFGKCNHPDCRKVNTRALWIRQALL